MIGSLIGAGAGLFGSIFGGIKASRAAKKAEQELANQRQANKDWYNRRYNEDYTQTAEAQSLLTKARETAQNQMREAVARQAVMGGTDASLDSARASAQGLVSNTLSDLGTLGAQRKAQIENQYMQRENALSDQYRQLYNQQAANASAAAGSAMQAGMGLVESDLKAMLETGRGLFGEKWGKKKPVTG